MKTRDKIPWAAVVSLHCSSCVRSFVALGEVVPDARVCTCGAPLLPRLLPRGLYELGADDPGEKSLVAPGATRERPTSDTASASGAEVDLGYGKSHGYDATHGGPSVRETLPRRSRGDRPSAEAASRRRPPARKFRRYSGRGRSVGRGGAV